MNKHDALTRILEAEPFDGMIIFARTKLGTEELATKLQARGFLAAAINGDLAQVQRERTIGQLKDGKIDILVATDVAARGLDVERISHVINFDVPHDPEGYTHRIGRTGRAGRSGEAILFITPRERGMLKTIERATRQAIEPLTLPTAKAVNEVRIAKFKDQISETLDAGNLEVFTSLIEDFERERNVPVIEIAAALAKMARGDVPLLLDKNEPMREAAWSEGKPDRPSRPERPERSERSVREEGAPRRERLPRSAEGGMTTYRIEVGHAHGVKPGNIVGAIANEAGIDSKHIGRIEIFDNYSLLDMPENITADSLAHLKSVWVAGQQLHITREGAAKAVAPFKKAASAAVKSAPVSAPVPAPVSAPAPVLASAPVPAPVPASESASAPRIPSAATPDLTEAAPAAPPVKKKAVRVKLDETEKFDRPSPAKKEREVRSGEFPMSSFRIEVGNAHGVKAANIVGAIANEAGLDARHIGRIEIFDDHSTLDLPDGMPKGLMEHLKKVVVAGQQIKISQVGKDADGGKKASKKVDNKDGADAKSAFGPRVTGGNRRVAEKSVEKGAGSKPPVKPGSGTDAAPKKAHRKGGKVS
jgi:ATP-dependent RNA helicase DeaD